MKAKKMIDCLHADAQRSRWFIFVKIFEGEEGRSGILEDTLDDVVDGRIVSALEAG